MSRIITSIALLLVLQWTSAAEIPMVVHTDAKQFGDDSNVDACALLITATSINGEYISGVIKLLDDNGQAAMAYTILSGHIDYSNGNEVYDYVENAWLTAGGITTRKKVKASRGPGHYAYKGYYSDDALSLYESLIRSPFELTLVTAMHGEPYTHTFEQPFDQFVSREARSCLQGFKSQHAGSGSD